MAAIMSLSYSTIAVGVNLANGKQPGVEYNLKGQTLADSIFGRCS